MNTPGAQSYFLSESEVARIAALQDPAARNQQITDAYWKLSTEVERRLEGHANWCTFATWASKQAGVTIRHEDLTDVLRERLHASWKIRGVDAILIGVIEEGGLDLLQTVVDAVSGLGPLRRSGDAVGRGNRKVFAEIGLQFSRWLTMFPEVRDISDHEMATFSESLASGPPPDGQDLLKQAFANYRAAARVADETEKAQFMLLADLQIGCHEQTRLQPDIQAAMDGALLEPGDLVRFLMSSLGPHQGRLAMAVNKVWPFEESPLEQITKMLAEDVHEVVRVLITENLMSIWLPPGEVVQLGRDLTRPFPEALQNLTNPDLLALVEKFCPTVKSEAGSGVRNWADFKQRMGFIAELFRAYWDDESLFTSPSAAGVASQP